MTNDGLTTVGLTFISTHILTKRMTKKPSLMKRQVKNFNSHPHEEDDASPSSSKLSERISTHILTKRMTDILCSSQNRKTHFNSHPHEEDDHAAGVGGNPDPISTHILTKRMTLAKISKVKREAFQLTSSRRG